MHCAWPRSPPRALQTRLQSGPGALLEPSWSPADALAERSGSPASAVEEPSGSPPGALQKRSHSGPGALPLQSPSPCPNAPRCPLQIFAGQTMHEFVQKFSSRANSALARKRQDSNYSNPGRQTQSLALVLAADVVFCPSAHALHSCAPKLLWYEPKAHGRHALELS